MNLMKKINNRMFNLSKIKFIFTMVILNFIITVMFTPVVNFYENNIGPMGRTYYSSLKIVFISAIIAAPLLETLVFQMGIINLFSLIEKIKNNKLLLIFISALCFGAVHFYSILYIIRAFISGIFLAYCFIVYEDKGRSGYWVTVITHSLMNLVSVIFSIMYYA